MLCGSKVGEVKSAQPGVREQRASTRERLLHK